MPEYCAPEDFGRFGINAAAIAELSNVEHRTPAIKGASGEIDSYLRARFTLPLLAFGDDIKECCAVLAAWTAFSTRGTKPGEILDDNPLYRRYKDKLAWLKMIAQGIVTPNVTDSSPGATPGVTDGGPLVTSIDQRGFYSTDGDAGAFSGRRR